MVVDLPIHGQYEGTVLIGERLGTTVDADNAQAFVGENGIMGNDISTPIRSAMSDGFGHLQCGWLEFLDIGMPVTGKYSTHPVLTECEQRDKVEIKTK